MSKHNLVICMERPAALTGITGIFQQHLFVGFAVCQNDPILEVWEGGERLLAVSEQ